MPDKLIAPYMLHQPKQWQVVKTIKIKGKLLKKSRQFKKNISRFSIDAGDLQALISKF